MTSTKPYWWGQEILDSFNSLLIRPCSSSLDDQASPLDGVVVASPLKLFQGKRDPLPGAHVQEGFEHVAGVGVVDPGAEVVVGLARSKIKGTYTSDWGMAKTAEKWGEPQKMTYSSKKEFFFGVVRMGKL